MEKITISGATKTSLFDKFLNLVMKKPKNKSSDVETHKRENDIQIKTYEPVKEEKTRTLKKNKYGKLIWTNGKEPFPLTEEEKKPFTGSVIIPNIDKLKMSPSFEIFTQNRFIVDFYGIPEHAFQDFFSNSETESTFKVLLYIDGSEKSVLSLMLELRNKIEKLKIVSKYKNKTIKKPVKKKKTSGLNASISIVDVIGMEVGKIKLNNVKVKSVEMFNDFSYSSSEPQYAHVIIEHDVRIIE